MSLGLRHSSAVAAVCGAPLPVGPFVAVVAIYVAAGAAEPPQGVVAFVVDVSVSSVADAEEAFVVEVFADVVAPARTAVAFAVPSIEVEFVLVEVLCALAPGLVVSVELESLAQKLERSVSVGRAQASRVCSALDLRAVSRSGG